MGTDGDKIAAATLVAAFVEKYWSPSSNPKTDPAARQELIRGIGSLYREMLQEIATTQP